MWRWVITTSGDRPGLGPALAKLGRQVLAGLDSRPGEPGRKAADVLARLGGDRRSGGSCRPGSSPALGWVIRNAGQGTRIQPLEREVNSAVTLSVSKRPAGALEDARPGTPPRRPSSGSDGDRRALLAAGQRLGQRLRLGVDLHRRPLSVAGRRSGPIARAAERRPGAALPRISSARMAEGAASQIFRPGLLDGPGLRGLRRGHRARAGDRARAGGAGRDGGRLRAARRAARGDRAARSARRAASRRRSRWTSATPTRSTRLFDGVVERHGRARRAGQQRRRPVPEPGRGDHPEGLSDRDRAERPGNLADDPRRGDQGVHPAALRAR